MGIRNSRLFRPDFIVAMLAVVIGLLTMCVYIYQANIMSKQMSASAWPYLETTFTTGDKGFAISVVNKGIGPAIVKSMHVILDNVRYKETQQNVDSVAFLLTGSRNILSGYSNVFNRVLSPGEVIKFVEVADSASGVLLTRSLLKHSVAIEICYCSVYDECFLLTGGKVEECETCP